MILRIVILGLTIVSLLCCGCRSTRLSAKQVQDITDFVREKTGEHVISLDPQPNGDVAVKTKITGQGPSCWHLWSLKKTPAGWKLIDVGILTL